MRDVLLSVRPRFVDLILAGKKTVELRRKIWNLKKDVDWAYVYASAPVQKVVAIFHPNPIYCSNIGGLWEMFGDPRRNVLGVSEDEFYRYFEGLRVGYALQITHLCKAKYPVPVCNIGKPPQNFRYLQEWEKDAITQFIKQMEASP